MVGIQYPIIRARMGPYCTDKLAIAAANAGALGIISTSGSSGYLSKPPEALTSQDRRSYARPLVTGRTVPGRMRWFGHFNGLKMKPGRTTVSSVPMS